MQFSRIISFFLAFFTLGAFALATPTPEVEKRVSDASIEDAFNTLSATLAPIFVDIQAAVDIKVVTEGWFTNIVAEINVALDVNAAALAVLEKRDVLKRQSESDIANLAAGIVADIAAQLDAVVVLDPALVSVAALVDVHISPVLVNLNLLIPGIISIIAGLLADISAEISALLWVTLFALLGLLGL